MSGKSLKKGVRPPSPAYSRDHALRKPHVHRGRSELDFYRNDGALTLHADGNVHHQMQTAVTAGFGAGDVIPRKDELPAVHLFQKLGKAVDGFD